MRMYWIMGSAVFLVGCQAAAPSSQVESNASPMSSLMSTAPLNARAIASTASPTTMPLAALSEPAIKPTLTAPAAAPIGSISVSGDIHQSGVQPLRPGEKIGDVLRSVTLTHPVGKLTVVLVRRGPEGVSNEMIDVGQDLSVIDARHNYDLRDGDQLVVSTVVSDPQGLARPIATETMIGH